MKLYVEGMSCNHCKMRVEKALSGISGVKSVTVDLEKGTAEVEAFGELDFDILKEIIDDAGYDLVKAE